MHRVFVYGTLKRGFRNHRFLENAKFLGEAHTVAVYRMLDGLFPVLRDSGPDHRPVSGEVYEIDAPTLIALDDLESVASGMYDRIEIDVVLSARNSLAFIYIGCGDYWDKKETVSYLVTDRQGHLNWLAPNMRSK
jgi:gamma-glutamylcyclotransferase (GGCT)/AIG2-like uncharacterized protein YtfP